MQTQVHDSTTIATGALTVEKDAYLPHDLMMMPEQHADCGLTRNITWESGR